MAGNHRSHDGCTGSSRRLSAHDHQEIEQVAAMLFAAAALGVHARVRQYGQYIALHYGTAGEWHLASLAARRIARVWPGGPGMEPAPGEPALTTLVVHMIAACDHDPVLAREGLPYRYRDHLDSAYALVRAMVAACARSDWADARRRWSDVYLTHNHHRHTVAAFTGLLVYWAAAVDATATAASSNATTASRR